ncbi:MAG TPA: MerR family transcriptional regulator [Kofleriaceae bacterium]|nr:MerR family transcriptional regulator [Kofleriaceae bacterium]
MSKSTESGHLSVIRGGRQGEPTALTRGQVAERLGVSVSTVRRFEAQERLHPTRDENGVNQFDVVQVAELALELADEPRGRRLRNAASADGTASAPGSVKRSPGEEAALVFERLEQRQSLAEIVVGVRITPERVRELYRQWTQGLTEYELRNSSQITVQLDRELMRLSQAELATRLAELPAKEATRISVARYRDVFSGPDAGGGDAEFASVDELGGFLVFGPCEPTEITDRYGGGDFRITAYGFEPSGLRWEALVRGLAA